VNRPHVDIEQHGPGRYAVQASSFAGPVRFDLVLADEVGMHWLGTDPATARAIVVFLLDRQDAADLPTEVDINAVFAAYPDAVGEIRALRDG